MTISNQNTIKVIMKTCVRCGIAYIVNEATKEFHKSCKRTYTANWKRDKNRQYAQQLK